MTVPVGVAAAIHRRWPHLAEPWLTAVDRELAGLCAEFIARPVRVFPARYSYAVAADSPDGPLVFRGTPDPAGAAQAAVGRALADWGVAPQIHESRSTPTGQWTVMDRVFPGEPLGNVSGSLMSAADLAAIFAPLVGRPASSGIPYIGEWLRERLEADNLADLPPGRQPAPATERARALEVLKQLEKTAHPGLCHGDASPGNILTDQGKALRLIDPRGFSGEVAYDIAVLAAKTSLNRPVSSRIESLSREVGLPVNRVNAWSVVATAARV